MESIELSLESSKEQSKKLAEKIYESYKYDLVIFIAKGSYTIGREIADYNDVELIEIRATRKGNFLKEKLKNVLNILPKNIKDILRNIELNSNIHSKMSERKIIYDESVWEKFSDRKKIILVDDSVDTGHSMKQCKESIEKFFKNSDVKLASLNVFSKSEEVIKIDYYLYKDKLCKGPWSNDSKENNKFIKLYKKYKENYK
ncbi:phosphoribosyltransferase [Clostridium baratii]|uniref:phosphoribosyltransferase n=1 Tax=Clostridium baratii TaxID=1561 RepID=UPI0030D02F46